MIKFQLTCAKDHRFESWFASSDAYTAVQTAGMLNCTICGSTDVQKALMAPAVNHAKKQSLTQPDTPEAAKLQALRAEIEKTADDVGSRFASEAREMHDGTKPVRAIYGQASGEEARNMLKDGIPVMPLPFIPSKKTN